MAASMNHVSTPVNTHLMLEINWCLLLCNRYQNVECMLGAELAWLLNTNV